MLSFFNELLERVDETSQSAEREREEDASINNDDKKFMAERRVDETSKSSNVDKREREEEASTSNDINFFVDIKLIQIVQSSLKVLAKIIDSEMNHPEYSEQSKKAISKIEVEMNELLNLITTTENVVFDEIVCLARSYLNIGYTYSLKPIYFDTAVLHFGRCLKLLEKKELHPKAILISIRVRNELGEIYLELQHFEKSNLLLNEALELYLNYTKDENYPDPIDILDTNFSSEERRVGKLTNLYILTLKCMTSLYCSQPSDKHKFVICVHNLLNKQLIKANLYGKKLSTSWAHTSACLSVYFIHHDRFMEAKIHLAAADYMKKVYRLTLKNQNYSESSEEYVKYKQLHACIAKFWGIYGVMLLQSSKTKLLQHESDKSCEANVKSESLTKSETELMEPLVFVDLDYLEKELENCEITDMYVSSLNDAKVVFTKVLKWLNVSRTLFLETSIKDFMHHVHATLFISKAYKCYAYFVESRNKKKKLIKQQIKFLENAINTLILELTPDDYKHYRKLYVELAVTYSTLLNMTYEEFNEIKDVTDEMKMEYKQLTKSVLDNYNLYMKET